MPSNNPIYGELYDQVEALEFPSVIKCNGKLYNLGLGAAAMPGPGKIIGQPKISIILLKELTVEEAKEVKKLQDEQLKRLEQKGQSTHGA